MPSKIWKGLEVSEVEVELAPFYNRFCVECLTDEDYQNYPSEEIAELFADRAWDLMSNRGVSDEVMEAINETICTCW